MIRFLVVQDHKENRRKCTLTALEGLPGIEFLHLDRPASPGEKTEVGPGILLHVDAPPLCRDDAGLLEDGHVVVVDSTWIRVPKVLARLSEAGGRPLERRSVPPGIVTAYPRASKLHRDPDGGLASVEAVFAAAVILGEPRPDVLQKYRWVRLFLERNQEVLRAFHPGLASILTSFLAS